MSVALDCCVKEVAVVEGKAQNIFYVPTVTELWVVKNEITATNSQNELDFLKKEVLLKVV